MLSILTLISIVLARGGDYPRHFVSITDSTRPICSQESRCTVTTKNDQKFQIFFKTKPEKDGTLVSGVAIRSLASDDKTEYMLPVPKNIVTGDPAPLFAADINGDGYNDLAMQSGLGSQVGFIFYYWVFNPKTKKFVLTKDKLPALQVSADKRITALTSNEEYRLNNSYELVLLKSK